MIKLKRFLETMCWLFSGALFSSLFITKSDDYIFYLCNLALCVFGLLTIKILKK